jgi:hypothetical protein
MAARPTKDSPGSRAARLALASSRPSALASAPDVRRISEARPRGPTESAVTLAGLAVPLRHPDHLLRILPRAKSRDNFS